MFLRELKSFCFISNKLICSFKKKLNKFNFFPRKYLKWKLLLKKYKLNSKLYKASEICKEVFQKKINEEIEFYTLRCNSQGIFIKKNKKRTDWLKLKELLSLEPILYYTTKLEFLVKIIEKYPRFKINSNQDLIQRIKRDENTSTNSFKRTVVLVIEIIIKTLLKIV